MSELPSGWALRPLAEICDPSAPIMYGILQPGPEVADGIPYVRPTEIKDGTIQLGSVKRTSAAIAKRYARSTLRSGDLLLSIVGTIGKVARVPVELDGANITQSSVRVRPAQGISTDYLEWLLKAPALTRQYDVARLGTGVPRLNVADVRALLCPVPPLATQIVIADKLNALHARSSAARAQLQAVTPLLETLRQSILAAAFRGDLTKDWRAKNKNVEPACVLLDRIRAERREAWEAAELAKMKAKGRPPTDDKWKARYQVPVKAVAGQYGALPESWCWASIEELSPGDAPAVYGIIQPGPHIPGGVPYIRPTDIRADGTVNVEAIKRTTPSIAANYRRSSLHAGDIVLSIVGTIGKVLTVPVELEGANITQSSARIRPLAQVVGPYIKLVLQSPELVRQFDAARFGVAVQRLNIEDVRALAVPLAPRIEAQEVVRKAQLALDRLPHDAIAQAARVLTALDRAVLSCFFSGSVSLP